MIKSSFRHLIALALFFAMLFSCFGCAFADEDNGGFTLRNGIMFGDTIDDILAKETTLKSTSYSLDSYDANQTMFIGTICGYDNSTCVFSFDESNMLYDMLYGFEIYDMLYGSEIYDTLYRFAIEDNGYFDAVYGTIYNGLKRKYGEPLYSNEDKPSYIIVGSAYNLLDLANENVDNPNLEKCCEWVIDVGSYHVKIDFALISWYFAHWNLYEHSILLSYHKFTDSDYEARIAEKLHEQEIIDRDL